MSAPGNPRTTFTCLLAGVSLLTLNVSCSPHIPSLTLQTKNQSKLEASSRYVPGQISLVSLVWKRRRAGSYGDPWSLQDARAAFPHEILVVGDKRMSRQSGSLEWGQTYHDQAAGPWKWRQPHTDKQADVVTRHLAPINQLVPLVWNAGTRRRQHGHLQLPRAPDLMTSSTATKIMFEKKKKKKTREISDVMFRQQASGVDSSGNSLFKEQQVLAKLLDLKKIFKKRQHQIDEDRSRNDMEACPDDKYSWSDHQPLQSHVPGETDLPSDHHLIGNVNDHKPRHGSFGQEINLPNVDTVKYSNGQKWSPSTDTLVDRTAPLFKHVSEALDKLHTPLNEPQSANNDVSTNDLQYSTLTDVFDPAPGVAWHENHQSGAISDVRGHFLDNNKDCHDISTKACLSDNECACAGFYMCARGRCQLLNDLKSPVHKHDWLSGPTDKHVWDSGPADEHVWDSGPADEHVWDSGPADEHGWINDPVDNHDWAHGRANIHGWANGPVEFVEEPGPSESTKNVVWHNKSFDFSKMETRVDPRPPTFWPEPLSLGFTDPLGEPQAQADVEKSADDPFRYPSPVDSSFSFQRTGTRSLENSKHNFLLEEPD